MKRMTPTTVLKEGLFYGILTLFGIFMLLPFLWSLSTSFKPNSEIFANPPKWIPSEITFQHYADAFTTVPFGQYFWNSFAMGAIGVASNLFLGSLAGYAYARMQFRGSKFLFQLQLASMMVPGVVTMIPTFIILRSFPFMGGNDWRGEGGFGLLNTYWAVILPGAAGAFAVFMMRQFFMTLPSDLGEAARIDSCGEFGIFWRIYFPLCKPALATLGLFTFQAGWNAFLWPLIVLNDPNLKTVQMGLQAFTYNRSTDYGPMMAASIVIMLPIIVLFVYAQRYFTSGLAFSGNK
jgi:multiple sugar transport system permease protein